MQEDLNYRLKNLEEEIQNMLLMKMRKKRENNNRKYLNRSSCPPSCEYVSRPSDLSASKSFLSKSLSAPSKINFSSKYKKDTRKKRDKKIKKNLNDLQQPNVSNTILNYIENLEKSLCRKVEEDSIRTCESLCSKTCSDATYEQSLICGNVLIASRTDSRGNEKQKSTKQIKKELTKIKQQLDNLEDSKRDAIEITKKVILKRDAINKVNNNNNDKINKNDSSNSNNNNKNNNKRINDENKSQQSTYTESQTIKVCESSQTSEYDLINKITKRDDLIKTLKESNKSLYKNLKKQEEKITHLTRSLQSSQAQLRENRKSFEKYENLLEENMMLSMKMNEFQQSLQKKDQTNKKILQAAEELAKDLQERDDINKRLNDTVIKLEETIIELGEMNKKLIQENNELCNNIKDKEEKYLQIKNKYDNVEKKIDIFKDQMQKSQLEIGRLRQLINNHGKQELSKEKDLETMRDELEEYKMNEGKFIEEIKNLTKQIRTIKAEKDELNEKFVNERTKINCGNKITRGTITEIRDISITCENTNNEEMDAREEIIQLRQTLSDNEKHLVKEKDELKGLVQELTNIIKTQKDRIGELSNFNRQQEQILEIQKKTLVSKEMEVDESRRNVEEMINRCTKLEDEITDLKSKLNILNETKGNKEDNCLVDDNSISVLVKELEDTLSILNSERDAVKIKDKIIESQVDAINELKFQINDKNDEINRADMQLKRLLKEFTLTSEESDRIRVELDEEKKTKEIMYEDIEKLRVCKEDLLKQFCQLEQQFANYYKCANVGDADVNNQEKIIESLQIQLKLQETEWLKNSHMLLSEKEKAIDAAKFATQKLVDTVNDFQKQVDAHQHIQKLLTTLLQEKDEKIRNTVTNMNKMTTELSRTQFPIIENYHVNGEGFRRQYSFDSIDNDTIKPNIDRLKEMNINQIQSSGGDCWMENLSQYLTKELEEKANNENCYQVQWLSYENDRVSNVKNIIQATSLASITQNKLQNAILSNANLCKTSKNDPWYSENHSKSQMNVKSSTFDSFKSYYIHEDYDDTAKNRSQYHGMEEVEEIFVRKHVEPKCNWPTIDQHQNVHVMQRNKPIRYFSLLNKDKL